MTTSRRAFLQDSSVAAAAIATGLAASPARANGTAERVRLGVIGCGGRGSGVARAFAGAKHCEVTWVSDPDATRAGSLATKLSEVEGNRKPRIAKDLREMLDDDNLDAVLVATPDHWHAPAAIMACEAGKHVYVEKPCSHNLREGRWLVEAARKHKRHVQHGTQSRSMELIVNAMQMLREGVIGDVLVSKAWNVQRRANIGHAQPSDPPKEVDYDTWVGPAPFVPFQKNRFHYAWHWWHNFGTGDAGNDGVHELDYARWGLGVEQHPERISGLGTKLYFDDDQQFPDTQQVAFEYPGELGQKRMLIFEMRIWSTNYPYNVDNCVEFYGTKGRMLLTKRGKMEVFGERNKRLSPTPRQKVSGLASHQENFLNAIRSGEPLAAEIEVGHLSSSLCHLANIAAKLGRSLEFDPGKEQVTNDAAANALLGREYRDHWGVPAAAST